MTLSARLLGFTRAQADQMAALARAVDMTRAGVPLWGITRVAAERRRDNARLRRFLASTGVPEAFLPDPRECE